MTIESINAGLDMMNEALNRPLYDPMIGKERKTGITVDVEVIATITLPSDDYRTVKAFTGGSEYLGRELIVEAAGGHLCDNDSFRKFCKSNIENVRLVCVRIVREQ